MGVAELLHIIKDNAPMGIADLLYLIKDYAPKDKEFIISAYEYANEVHKNVKRQSGEPYISHPLAVACIVALMRADVDTIVSCLLHDVIEDGKGITQEALSSQFNSTVGVLVDGVSKLPKLSINNSKIDTDNYNLRKMFLGAVTDIRIIIIKLADRLHNMITLDAKSSEKQIEISEETRMIYVSLAYLIGAYDIKQELDDYAFKYLEPTNYLEMKQLLKTAQNDNYGFINGIVCEISKLLTEMSVPFEVKLRVKSLYSLFKKLKKYGDLDKIHDLFSVSFVLENIEDCYRLRDEIEAGYNVLSRKTKDYIKNPKDNMYSALHTTIQNEAGSKLQLQLTTKEKALINTYGITAYWEILKFNHAPEHMQEDFSKKPFYHLINELHKANLENAEFNKEVTENISIESITVFTPNGEAIEIPKGATPVDFAYKIHEDIGNWIVSALINGERKPLDYELKKGDQVAIIFQENLVGPRPDLMSMCRTVRAKRKIREFNRWLNNV